MKVWDCFLFESEVALLRIRLEELYPVVDGFVMVQGEERFSGEARKVRTLDQLGLGRFAAKVRQVNVGAIDVPKDAGNDAFWMRERHQRNAIPSGLPPLEPDDLVMISDVDELIRPQVVQAIRANPEVLKPEEKLRFEMQFHYYFLDCLVEPAYQPWKSSIALTWRRLQETTCDAERIAHQGEGDRCRYIPRAGWHFSLFGGAEAIRRKIRAHSDAWARDAEGLSEEEIHARVVAGKDVFGRDWVHKLVFQDRLPELPATVSNSIEHYRRLGWVRSEFDGVG